jgi:hypothetical protein
MTGLSRNRIVGLVRLGWSGNREERRGELMILKRYIEYI